MLRICSRTDPDFETRLSALTRRTAELPAHVEAAAREVIAEVRARGDQAVRAFTERFEKRTLAALELPRAEWEAAAAGVDPRVRRALERAADRVRAFHRRELHPGFELAEEGIRLGLRVTPLERVGLYVPGGLARYPSTVIMTAVPAKVAGVSEVLMLTPGPSPETWPLPWWPAWIASSPSAGPRASPPSPTAPRPSPAWTRSSGPGNAYVTAAKRLVYGDVGIDMIAGPPRW
jgi:histidinol dehydrogenase